MTNVRIIAITGISGSGKSRLADSLDPKKFHVLRQDESFLPAASQLKIFRRGIWYIDWERLHAMDVGHFNRAFEHAKEVAREAGKILVVEGHALTELLAGMKEVQFVFLCISFGYFAKQRRHRNDPLRSSEFPYMEHVWEEHVRRCGLMGPNAVLIRGKNAPSTIRSKFLQIVEEFKPAWSMPQFANSIYGKPRRNRVFPSSEAAVRDMFVSYFAGDCIAFSGAAWSCRNTELGACVPGQCGIPTESLSFALRFAAGGTRGTLVSSCIMRAPAFVICETIELALSKQEEDAAAMGCTPEDLVCSKFVLLVLWERVRNLRLYSVSGAYKCIRELDVDMLVIPHLFSGENPFPEIHALRAFMNIIRYVNEGPLVSFRDYVSHMILDQYGQNGHAAIAMCLFGVVRPHSETFGVFIAPLKHSKKEYAGCMTPDEMMDFLFEEVYGHERVPIK